MEQKNQHQKLDPIYMPPVSGRYVTHLKD